MESVPTPAGTFFFWTSEPVRPGEAVNVIGEGLDQPATVEIVRVPDALTKPAFDWKGKGEPATVLEAGGQGMKFLVPAKLEPGLYAYRVSSVVSLVYLNIPAQAGNCRTRRQHRR